MNYSLSSLQFYSNFRLIATLNYFYDKLLTIDVILSQIILFTVWKVNLYVV